MSKSGFVSCVLAQRDESLPLCLGLLDCYADPYGVLDGRGMTAMYEPLWLVSDAYPGVVPNVRTQGFMALAIAISILWALVWLTYRAYQVCATSDAILVDKLGLDIPPTPEVTLEEIRSRHVRIAWKYPEYQNSVHRHIIRVNGTRAGESKRSETAVSIQNLMPAHIYHVCVTAVSGANFQTSSAVLHMRTTPSTFCQTEDDDLCGVPIIRAYVPKPASLVSPSAPVMSREHSGGQLQGKRASGGKKPPPSSTAGQEQTAQAGGESRRASVDDSEESLEQLAERLKGLQQENETLEKQIAQDEKEHEITLKELEEQRNELKQRVKEKDEASGDLRKHINKLESVNRTAQSEKNKRERQLQQREAERQKRKEDIARWEAKISEMQEEVTRVNAEKTRVEEAATKRMEECRGKISDEQTEMKTLDEDIQVKGSRIKQLEDERRRLEGGDNEEEREFDRLEKERERLWEVKLANLRAQYASLISVHAQAQQQLFEAQERIKWVTSNYPSDTASLYTTLAAPDVDISSRTSIKQRSHHRSSLSSKLSSPGNVPIGDTGFINANNYNQVGNGSPTFPSGSAFLNINNGMTIPDPNDQANFTRMDNANPPMSPRADALLPSDLLGDEEPIPTSRPSSNQFPSLGTSAAPFEPLLPASRSPESSKSIAHSVFASPHGSLNNLPEDERESSQETKPLSETPPTQSTSRRISGLFGFNRQRGKTVADGPPPLGSLRPGQSQSFPRNLDQGLDPIGTRRRRLSYTGSWANPMTNLFPRSPATADSSSDCLPSSKKTMFPNIFASGKQASSDDDGLGQDSPGHTKNGAGYNQFSPRHDPIDPSILGTVQRDSLSPRPSSTYSFDHSLPIPTGDSQPFGWPAQRNIPLGFDWSSPATWSRSRSRRPSAQRGSSSHLPLGLPVTDADFLERTHETHRPVQAPIGTRPPSSHQPSTPKLNPAAPTFKTLFGKKQDKTKNKEGVSSKSRDHEPKPEDLSPPVSRRSKDSRSVGTSAAESHESLERVSSSTPSEPVNPKESFIQKIARKGSSGKFNVPWKDRSGLFSKKGENNSQGDIDEDGTSEINLGKSLDSTISSTNSGDRSTKSSLSFSFMRKAKKEKAASESSEKASETGDEDLAEA